MSIGIYAFLRIYFLSFGLSAFAQFRTHCPTSNAAAVPIAQRAQRPGVCVCAWRGLPCIWHGLRRCLSCADVPGALGLGSPPAGYIAAAQPRPVSPVTTEKIKKAQKKSPHPLLSISKISRKNKKTPTKGLCSVLYLP